MELKQTLKTMDTEKKFAKRKGWGENKYLYLICSKEENELGYVVGVMDYSIKDEDEQSQPFIPSAEELKADDYELIHY